MRHGAAWDPEISRVTCSAAKLGCARFESAASWRWDVRGSRLPRPHPDPHAFDRGNDSDISTQDSRHAPGWLYGYIAMFPSTQHPRATQIPQSVAALVDNIQAAAGKTKHTAPNKQQLKQLLDEFFDADNQISSIGSSAAGYGGDNSTHLKLIEVVTSLGISVLLEDDPFASPAEGSFTEATNSLFLIRRVILQTPFVLLETVETADSSRAASPRPPLYLWLAVRLLPVLACGHTVELVPHLIQTLQCILASLHALPEGWNACRILMQFCTGSLECILIPSLLLDSRNCSAHVLIRDVKR